MNVNIFHFDSDTFSYKSSRIFQVKLKFLTILFILSSHSNQCHDQIYIILEYNAHTQHIISFFELVIELNIKCKGEDGGKVDGS